MSELFDTELDSGSKCLAGHPVHLVAEGYGLCLSPGRGGYWSAWALTKPATPFWGDATIKGRDGKPILAWVSEAKTKEKCLARIQEDIDARRAMPFDEEAERSRLMPV